MIFAFDRLTAFKPYPNVATWQAQPYTDQWRQFSVQWPFSEPMHFLEYLDQENIVYSTTTVESATLDAIYPISLSFFDFSINWKDLIPDQVFKKDLLIWFLYSEGDNPEKIKLHLDKQLKGCRYHFTSANSSAEQFENFSYFADDELLFQLRNESTGIAYHKQPRHKLFTALCRTHKWWRATTMARIWNQGLHRRGYFSYNNKLEVGESELDNPIRVDDFAGLRNNVTDFLQDCPFYADDYDSDWHNLYHNTVHEHFSDSYLNLIIETHLDADGSGGTFLTEKTFKPIKHSQLFLIIGPPGSIAQLKKMGYRTFDTWIDHGYDTIEDNTLRWHTAMREFERVCKRDLHRIYCDCAASIEKNQQLFLGSKADCLNNLLQKVKK